MTHVLKHGSIADQTEECCRHFDGVNFTDPNKCCKAGVTMASVTIKHDPSISYRYEGEKIKYSWSWSIPCNKSLNLGEATCDHSEFPTREEAERAEKEWEEYMERTMRARAAIVEATHGQVGLSGKIECPICESGQLNYSIAKCNGHIHAACSTIDCVRWME